MRIDVGISFQIERDKEKPENNPFLIVLLGKLVIMKGMLWGSDVIGAEVGV